jgi:AmpD protein
MEAYLPELCYNPNRAFEIRGSVIHWISVTKSSKPLDLGAIWLLLVDLNLEKARRTNYPDCAGAERTYASYHRLIGRDGTDWILVPEDKYAYHAGESSYKGINNWNSFSLGISLAGTPTSGYTDAQYEKLAKIEKALMKEYGFKEDMIVGHETISPNRRKDPGIATGNFDMPKFKGLLNT